MFYEPRGGKAAHGLPHDPFKAIVAPRPIGWISTLDEDGVANLAPYSFFNGAASHPPIVMFAHNGLHSDGKLKDSARNAEATGAFVHCVATWALRDAMNQTSAGVAHGVDEFELAGLTKAPSRLVAPPRVAESPVAFECRFLRRVDLPSSDNGENVVIFGEVVGVHIDESVLTNGRIDYGALRLIARMGYMDYAVIDEAFSMTRPPGAGG